MRILLACLFVIASTVNAWDAGPASCAHSPCHGGAVKRGDSKWTGNTHLYITQQALQAIKNSKIDAFTKIEKAMNTNPCKKLWENGLWDIDGPELADSTQKGSHFYNPAHKDWNGDHTTSITWKDVLYDHTSFGNALSNMNGYLRYPPEKHCYTLGRALHFITDATMPFHTAGMSALNGVLMLHPYFEEYIPVIQQSTDASDVKWPADVTTSRSIDIWLGEAPSCAASAADCTKHNMQFIKSSDKGDGAACVTGHKVLCRLTAPAWPNNWDKVDPSDMLVMMSKRSNKYAAALSRIINASGGICTYTGLGMAYTGDCFRGKPAVKAIVSFLLRDAFLATANMLYSIFNHLPHQPTAVTQWFGTAPACAGSSLDCKLWGGVQIAKGSCGDGKCCTTGHKVKCQKMPGNFKDTVWVGTAPSCSTGPSDCHERNMIHVKNDNCGDGACCVTGHKVLCRYKWLSSDVGFDQPKPVFDERKVKRWFGTAPFCGGEPADCTKWGGKHVKNHDCGDGDCCTTGHKVLCEKIEKVPSLIETEAETDTDTDTDTDTGIDTDAHTDTDTETQVDTETDIQINQHHVDRQEDTDAY